MSLFSIDVRKHVVLDIGHSKSSKGAYNTEQDIFEYEFNERLADIIIDKYNKAKYVTKKSEIEVNKLIKITKSYRDEDKNGYYNLGRKINSTGANFCISLHCNAFNEKASGTEVLYPNGSVKSKSLAYILQNNLVATLGLEDRGIKAISHDDRGGGFVHQLKIPVVISEAFFIDNNNNLNIALLKLPNLAECFIKSSLEFCNITNGEIIIL